MVVHERIESRLPFVVGVMHAFDDHLYDVMLGWHTHLKGWNPWLLADCILVT